MRVPDRFEKLAIQVILLLSVVSIGAPVCQAQSVVGTESPIVEVEENPLAAVFRSCDRDGDGLLAEDEYLNRGGREPRVLRRDFKVFDSNRDGKLSLTEFLAVPVGQPEELRGAVRDPVIVLCESAFKVMTANWSEWDLDGNGSLNHNEFIKCEFPGRILGLEKTTFENWDLDQDWQIKREEVRRVLEVTFGVRAPSGELHRSKSGQIADWRAFKNLKLSDDGFVSREEYFRALGPTDEQTKEAWFKLNDKNNDGKFNYAEFVTGFQRTDPLENFLQLDINLDGRLDPDELQHLPPDRFPVADYLFPGFDDDRDGFLSLEEFQLTPVVNLLAAWESAIDINADRLLTFDEFQTCCYIRMGSLWTPPSSGMASPYVIANEPTALCAEYFRRLDTNGDNSLSLEEFPFNSSHPPTTEIYVLEKDGNFTTIAIPGYSIICSPEISPDNKWVAADAWNHGQPNTAAHVLIASLETDEVRDVGIGCMPNWSPDGQRIAFCKYGRGVFTRNALGNVADEESIDVRGWSIQYSPDGLNTAYLKGNNIIICDGKTGAKKPIFPDGQSPYRTIDHNLTWSADSRRISFRGHRNDGAIDIAIVSTIGNDPKLRVRCNGMDALPDFAWHPDGKRLMFPRQQAGRIGQIYEMDPDGDNPPTRFAKQPKHRNNGGLCWSRDGQIFAFVSTR